MDHVPHAPVAPVLGGRYELGALLGRGGMSEVYRAKDLMMQRAVAVKVLRANGSDDTMARRMSQEARIVAAVDHPHLARVHDAGCEDGQCYLVMELVDGGTLGDLVERGPLPAELAARIGAQLAHALGAIHAAGFVHRDIKPANVLLAGPDGPDGAAGAAPLEHVSARLTDFGIARMVDGTRLTSTGLMLGTAPYLSPEQVLGTLVSLPSDIYALGLLLLECRTAVQAYPGPAVESAVARLHRQPDVPATLGPGWVALLTAMTARDPDHRPTAAQAAAILDDLAEGRSPVGAGVLLPVPEGEPGAEPVGEPVPARRGGAAGARALGGVAGGHHPRGTHATHTGSRALAAADGGRHPLRSGRRLVAAAAAAAAVFTAAALISGGSSPFRDDRPQASQGASQQASQGTPQRTSQRSTTASRAQASRSATTVSAAGSRTGGAAAVRLAAAGAGQSAAVEQAAGTSAAAGGTGSSTAPSGSGQPPGSAASGAAGGTPGAGGSSAGSSHRKSGHGSPAAPSKGSGASSTSGSSGGSNSGGSSKGGQDSSGGTGGGAGHSATGDGSGGSTAGPSTSPTSGSNPASSDPPSSSDPSTSTDSPSSTPDPSQSVTAPTQDPLVSGSASIDSGTGDTSSSDLSQSPAGLRP